MKPIDFPSAPLAGDPKQITVTDLAFLVRPTFGHAIGQVWFETEFGPSRAWIHAAEFGGTRLFHFTDHATDDQGTELSFEVELIGAISTFLSGIRFPVTAPVVRRKPPKEFAAEWAREMVTYLCPFCGDEHHCTVRHAGPDDIRPPCESVIPMCLTQPLPTIVLGEDIDADAYERGAVTLRLSRQITRKD